MMMMMSCQYSQVDKTVLSLRALCIQLGIIQYLNKNLLEDNWFTGDRMLLLLPLSVVSRKITCVNETSGSTDVITTGKTRRHGYSTLMFTFVRVAMFTFYMEFEAYIL